MQTAATLRHLVDADDDFSVVRQRLDALQDLSFDGLGPETTLAQVKQGMQLAKEAIEAHPRASASPLLVLVRLEAAGLNIAMAMREDNDKARLEQALDGTDKALEMATHLAKPAPLVETRGLYQHGLILAHLNRFAEAMQHLDEVIAVLEPHVAQMDAMGDVAGPEMALLDRHIRAREVLDDARQARQELMPMVAAIGEVRANLELAMASDDPMGTLEGVVDEARAQDRGAVFRRVLITLVVALGVAAGGWLILPGIRKLGAVLAAGAMAYGALSAPRR